MDVIGALQDDDCSSFLATLELSLQTLLDGEAASSSIAGSLFSLASGCPTAFLHPLVLSYSMGYLKAPPTKVKPVHFDRVVLANCLALALQTSEAWPLECLQVFLDDFTQARLWSTSPSCALFVDEMQVAIGLPQSSAAKLEECKKRFHDGGAVSGAVLSVIRHRLLGAGSGGYVVSSVGVPAMLCLAGCDMMYAVEICACSIISCAPKLLLRVLSAPSLQTRDVSNMCRLLPPQPFHPPSCVLALAIHRCYLLTSTWPVATTILKWFEDAKLQSAVDVIACCFTLFQACIASSIDKTSEDRCAVLVSACGFMSCLLAAAVRQCAQLEACGELSVQASPAIRPATVATASLEHMPDLALAVEFDISIDAPMKRRKAVAPQPAATLEQRTLILPMATSAAANVHQLIITVLEQIFNCFSTLLRGFCSDNVSDAIATCTQAILLSPFNDVLCKHLQVSVLKTDRVFVSMMHAATGASLLSPNACIRVLLRVCEACLACATKPFQLDDASVRAMFIGVSTLLQAHQHHAGPAAMWSPVHTQALHLILTLTCLYESCAALHVWRGTAGIAATALMWYAVTNQWQQPWRPVSAIATLLHNMSGSTKIWPVCVDAFPIEALSDMMLSSVRGSPAARALSDRLKTASYYLTEAIEAAVTVAVDGCAILCVPPASLRVDWILEYVRSHVNVPAAVLLKLMKQQLSCQSLVLQPAVITALRESFQIKSVFDAITASSRLPTSIISDAIVGYLKRETMTARQKDGDRFQRHCHELVPTLQWLLSQFQTRDGSHFAHAVLQAVFEPVSSSLAAMPVSFAIILISLLTDGKPALLSFMNTCVQCLPPGNTATGCPAPTGTSWVAGMCLSLYLCGISSDSIVELLNTVLQHAPILLSSLHLPSDSPLLCDIFVAAGCWSLSVSGQGQSPQITTTFPCSILNAFELCIATSELHCCVLLTSAPCASLLLSALRLAREMVATPPSAAAVSLSFIQRCGVFIAELTSMYVAAGFTGAGTQVQSDDAILIDVVFPTPALNVPATSDHSLLGSTVGELPLVSLYKQREAGRISSSHAKQALIDVSVLFPADIETIPFQSAMLKSLLWALSSITDESFDVWPIVSVIFRFGSPFSVDTLTDMHAQLRTLPPLVRNQLHCSGCDLWPPHRTITSLLMCTAAFIDDITLFSLTHLDWIIAVISNCDWSTDSALWISLHRSCIAPLLRALCEESATICIRDLITHLNTAMSTHLGHTIHFASMLSACYMLNPDSVYDAACAGALGWSWSACDDIIMFLQRQCTSDITLLAEKHMLQSPTTRLMRLRQTVCNIGNTARACVAAARHPYIAIFCTQPIAARLLLALDEQRSIFSNDSPPVHLLLALISDTAVLHAMMHLVRVLASALEVLEHTSLARLPAMAHVEIARSLAPLHQIVQLIGDSRKVPELALFVDHMCNLLVVLLHTQVSYTHSPRCDWSIIRITSMYNSPSTMHLTAAMQHSINHRSRTEYHCISPAAAEHCNAELEALLGTSLLQLSAQERLAQVLRILVDACRHPGVLPVTTLQLVISCLIDGHDICAESINLMIEIMTSACCTARRLMISARAHSIQVLLATSIHRAGVNIKALDSLIDIVSTLQSS